MYCITFISTELGHYLALTYTNKQTNYFWVEISFLFAKYFFQPQLATANRINAETIIRSAIFPPELSEIQTAHKETHVSG